MGAILPIVCLARHGETTWSLSGQHTGLTDLPLTERGELNAQSLGRRLRGFTFEKVFTSPLKRATRTCELAGIGSEAEADRGGGEGSLGRARRHGLSATGTICA
jgi:probable phosphoglycerate mutase